MARGEVEVKLCDVMDWFLDYVSPDPYEDPEGYHRAYEMFCNDVTWLIESLDYMFTSEG